MLELRALVLLLAAAALLAGCAGGPPGRLGGEQVPERYTLDARFALRQTDKSHSGRLSWQHAGNVDVVLLQDPFGRGVAEIEQGEGGARARLAEGRILEAADAAELVFQLTGIRLPLAGVGRWLPARLATTGAGRRDAQGRLLMLERDGWQIEYGYGEDAPEALPARIFARYGELELRLSIERWELAP